MDVSLSDQYVLLLQNVVNENRLLREQMKHTVDQAKSSLDEINKKVDSLKGSTAGPMRRVRQTGRPIHVPKICRNNVRRKLKSIKAHDGDLSFRFIESVDSQHHSMLVGKVIEELAHEYGGPEKCPWSAVLIKEAFKTYFRSARASHIRTTKGTQQAHITSCRRRNRKDEKLARRLKQMEKASWTAEKVARVAQVLTPDYMSSEESEVDEQGSSGLTYTIHRLPWESRQLRKAKKTLDRLHKESLSNLIQRRVAIRKVGQASNRPKPSTCPDWACTLPNEAAAVGEVPAAVASEE